jgi:hypothetical protein
VQTKSPDAPARPILHHCLQQAGVLTVAWVLGHQIFDLLGLLLQITLSFSKVQQTTSDTSLN